MKYRKLGTTDIDVSAICLGTMTWGQQNSETEAFEQLDYALEHGINFMDTAEMYPVPAAAETQGRTEEYIGNWIKERGCRDKIILATKIVAGSDWAKYIRGDSTCLDGKNIERAVEDSLRRLKTDYIDLYQVHWPERDTNFFGQLNYFHAPEKDGTPIEETLAALSSQISAGKIRHIGISNETPWGLSEYLRLSKERDLPRVMSIQNPYSLLNRTFEIGLAEMACREQVGLLAYSPLGFGVLTGKYNDNSKPAGARLTLFGNKYPRYTNELGIDMTTAYTRLAIEHGLEPAQMALAWVNSRPFVTSTIIGATNLEQLKTNIESIDIELAGAVKKEIERLHISQPNPCP